MTERQSPSIGMSTMMLTFIVGACDQPPETSSSVARRDAGTLACPTSEDAGLAEARARTLVGDNEHAVGRVPVFDIHLRQGREYGRNVARTTLGSTYLVDVTASKSVPVHLERRGPDGVTLWDVALPNIETAHVLAIEDEACIVFGSFTGTFEIEDQVLESVVNPPNQFGSAITDMTDRGRGLSSKDGLAARFEADGTLAWVLPFYGRGEQGFEAGVVLSSGDVLLYGTFEQDITAGDRTMVSSRGIMPTGVFARLDTSGTVLGFHEFTWFSLRSLVADHEDGWAMATSYGWSHGAVDVIARFAPNGEALWQLNRAGHTTFASLIVLDPDDNLYFTASPLEVPDEPALDVIAEGERGLVKVDPTGRIVWVEPFAFPGTTVPPSIGLRGGRLAVAGAFEEDIDVGLGPLRSLGQQDAFLAEWDLDGNPIYALQVGSSGYDSAFGVKGTPTGWEFRMNLGEAVFLGPAKTPVPRGVYTVTLSVVE